MNSIAKCITEKNGRKLRDNTKYWEFNETSEQ